MVDEIYELGTPELWKEISDSFVDKITKTLNI